MMKTHLLRSKFHGCYKVCAAELASAFCGAIQDKMFVIIIINIKKFSKLKKSRLYKDRLTSYAYTYKKMLLA